MESSAAHLPVFEYAFLLPDIFALLPQLPQAFQKVVVVGNYPLSMLP